MPFTYDTALREVITPLEPINPVHERHLICIGFYRHNGLWVRRSYDKGPFAQPMLWELGMPAHPKPAATPGRQVGAS